MIRAPGISLLDRAIERYHFVTDIFSTGALLLILQYRSKA